jgi:AcrR family transcriptional regulator
VQAQIALADAFRSSPTPPLTLSVGMNDVVHREPNEPLTAEVAVRAAMNIVDREGLAALTMRRLGRALGVEAMSIYHHVPNKSALLDLLVGEILGAVADVESWDTPVHFLEQYCRNLRAAIGAHANLAPLIAERLTPLTREAAPTTAIVHGLVGAGFDHEAATWIVDGFVGYTIGHSVVELAAIDRLEHDDAVFETGLRLMLEGLRDELGL